MFKDAKPGCFLFLFRLFPKGYRLEEIVSLMAYRVCVETELTFSHLQGPKSFENVGIDQVMLEAARIQGCPITGPWQPKTSGKA